MAQAQQSFIRGAAILGVAALVSKLLGAVYRIPYQNITGNEGMYVYQQVYPLYSVLLTLATAGFPIVISKLVSEKLAAGDEAGARRIFRVAATTLFMTGCFFFAVLFFGAGQVAEWMGNRESLTLPIQTVSLALLVVPFMSAVRGYFQGHQNMMPTAVSQVVEQTVRVVTILTLAWFFMESGFGYVYAGAGAVFGAFTGALAGLIALGLFWRKARLSGGKNLDEGREPAGRIIWTILALSFPICLGSLVLPLYSLVDSFTVANVLVESGWSEAAAIDGKGVYDRGQPLIQFASFFATAIALSVVPAIAELKAANRHQKAAERAALAIRLTWLFGLPASVGLAVIAEPVNVMLFEDGAGSDTLAILAFTALFSTLGITASGILQGLGRVYLPALCLLAGAGVKWALNLWLIPLWDLRGAAVSTVVAYMVATTLNLAALSRCLPGMGREWARAVKGLGAVGWMAAAVFGVTGGVRELATGLLEFRPAMSVSVLAGVLVGVLVYFWALFRFGALVRADLESVPKLRAKLLPLLDKWRLIRM
jgi:PST family polysaccharide transporter